MEKIVDNHVILVVDGSGSMAPQIDKVIGSVNVFVEALQGNEEDPYVTVFVFDDTRWERLFSNRASHWFPITRQDYRVGGRTPLYDSIAKAIQHGEDTSTTGDKVVIVIETDGMENASSEYDFGAVTSRIRDKQKEDWLFVFLGSELTKEAANTVANQGSSLGTQSVSTTHDQKTKAYKVVADATMDWYQGNKEALQSRNIQKKIDDDEGPKPAA